MKKRAATSSVVGNRRRLRHSIVAIVLFAMGSQTGCSREFYREWANQDVTEAVFEKSRDPRYRLDVFSINPPALARFADPYDPDRPPAPPDDFAAQALSPVPQWPDHRVMMPVEGTGYLKILDEGSRYEAPTPAAAPVAPVRPGSTLPPPPPLNPGPFPPNPTTPSPADVPPLAPTPAQPVTPTPGPGASRSNSGTVRGDLSPTSVAAKASPVAAPPAKRSAPTSGPVASSAKAVGKDNAVRQTAMQTPAGTMPTQTPDTLPNTIPPSRLTAPGDPIQTPRLSQDPLPTDSNLSLPRNPRPDLSPEQFRQSEEISANLARMFVPQNVPFNEAIAAGLKADARPYVLTMEKAFQLGLLNSRVYQFQLENVYLNALPVTLQRFSFGPQFIAGLSPTTAVAGAGAGGGVGGGILPAQIPANSFLYSTRATGAQSSALNYGTVAGVGKMFDNGAKVLASFANQLVFNFVGKNPMQPTVKSFLPIQAMVPFLRGGGRAVTLEALTQAERSLLYSVRQFALFRQQFVVTTLAGGTEIQFGTSVSTGGFQAGSGNDDPTTGFINVVEDVALLENFVKNVAVFERLFEVYKELVNGESSGLSQLQVDQISQSVQGARSAMLNSQVTYRNDLDQFKIQIGMPPDVPCVIDRSRTLGFKRVFEDIDSWSLSAKREQKQVDAIVSRLPKLEDLILDGRSCQDVFTSKDDSELEDLLLTTERIALENRLDLMNTRAQLYDSWRQIRVTANALKGVLNVAVTNQYLTPPTTNNPFGFVDQAKSFSLVINAELPLVRVAERNNFLTALINYQRQRRTLQNAEDFLKYQLRNEVRFMKFYYQQYLIAQRNLVLSVLLKDQAFEQIIAPPQPNAGGSQAPLQTTNLINFQTSVVTQENNLVTYWYQYQLYRLQVYRDLGILPYDEWEAFDEIFPPDRTGRAADVAIGGDGRPAVASPVQPSPPVGRN